MAPVSAPPNDPLPVKTPREALALLIRISAARALYRTSDAHLMKPWMAEKTLMTFREAVLRNFVLNHNVHHRAQMESIRLNDIPCLRCMVRRRMKER